MDLKKEMRKYALQNAVKYGGKANPGAVAGQILHLDPNLKARMKELMAQISPIVAEVNKMKPVEQTAELEKTAPELLDWSKEEKPKELPHLPVRGKVVTRMPPEPSKHAHIGHALAFLTNYLFAEKHKGKCVLRFEDTNPEKSSQEFVDSIREDVAWLGIAPDKEVIMSDMMEKFYSAGEILIAGGNAYACFCNTEVMRDLRFKGVACSHRDASAEQNLEVWKKMQDGEYQEGEVAIRLRADLQHNNGTMRDPVIFRIDYHEHYRHGDKYSVWPMYDLASVVAEEDNGVTHVLRSTEFTLRAELHNFVRSLLGYKGIEVFEFGRFNVMGYTTKGRETRELIEKGELLGWDDPRLMTLKALRRRGILPETVRDLVFDIGFKRDDANIDFTRIANLNRTRIDREADRYFFVQDPVGITVKGAPEKECHLASHPDHPERGTRIMRSEELFLIAKNDYDGMVEGKVYRLMECLNLKKAKAGFVFDSQDVESYRKRGAGIFHWLPDNGELVDVEVVMPDASVVSGKGEPSMKRLKAGDIVQLERFGFCRVDSAEEGKVVFWYTHK